MRPIKLSVAVFISVGCALSGCSPEDGDAVVNDEDNRNIFIKDEDHGKIRKIEIYALGDLLFAFPPEDYSGFKVVLELTEKNAIKTFLTRLRDSSHNHPDRNYAEMRDSYPEFRHQNYLIIANQNVQNYILIDPSENDSRIPVIRYPGNPPRDYIVYKASPLFASYLAYLLERLE